MARTAAPIVAAGSPFRDIVGPDSASYLWGAMPSGPTNASSHTRAMIVFAVAVLGVVVSGLVAAVAPRPQPMVAPLPVDHVTPPASPRVEVTHAS